MARKKNEIYWLRINHQNSSADLQWLTYICNYVSFLGMASIETKFNNQISMTSSVLILGTN